MFILRRSPNHHSLFSSRVVSTGCTLRFDLIVLLWISWFPQGPHLQCLDLSYEVNGKAQWLRRVSVLPLFCLSFSGLKHSYSCSQSLGRFSINIAAFVERGTWILEILYLFQHLSFEPEYSHHSVIPFFCWQIPYLHFIYNFLFINYANLVLSYTFSMSFKINCIFNKFISNIFILSAIFLFYRYHICHY